uniref:Vitamin B12-dependent ribonucleotide reductase n=1 Tax=Thermogemmatispora argillosa TaxID=2045280 RepID=A0A455T989_9CHLR|nr:ribonucleoside-diphosphate reductase [Thermogemmatispora argillosa]
MAFSANQTRSETPVTIDPEHVLAEVCRGFEDRADRAQLLEEVQATLCAGLSEAELWQALLLVARAHIEQEPAFSYITARILLLSLYREALRPDEQLPCTFAEMESAYRRYLPRYIQRGIETGLLDSRLAAFDLERIATLIRPERDLLFTYPGLQTLYDRYLLQYEGQRFELPQLLWLRVAMGLALNEEQKEQRVAEFYEVLSQFYFTPATPTLFNAGTSHPQLSSCYLTTVKDDLWHIFKCIQDNALLSKWAGGLGNDWTRVRALGAYIRGTNGRSQGVIPFLKVVNDTAVAVNQGGKRKGAVCAYLENWHLDIEDFLDLRRNTGDERRRTHDLHTACWISDEFMRRVERGEQWTLFSPDEVPDLHELYGRAFAERYREYERLADEGKIRLWKRMPAVELWRKMLTRLFETGHPWLTWKDPANVRSPQDHAGVIHSSNLCTEILLNTSEEETAVCNLGSLNLVAHLVNGQLDHAKLRSTIQTAMRMLDNVIDINYYPTPEARTANLRHRPVGLGVMGFQDALFQLGISYASQEAVEFADRSMEAISYYAILASSELAAERGPYPSYRGSKWDRGLLPIDTIALLEQERGEALEMDRSTTMDWELVRAHIRQHGMRNSNVLAIAPTATISLIVGVSPSIEPIYKNLYVKSTLSGEFTTVNTFLVNDLKAAGLWNADMLEALKYYDGSLQELPMVPEELKQRYLTAFEIDPRWLIECASRRQKWIDMGQSLNLYLASPSGKQLHEIYLRAWKKGLKTTYYLRTLAATQVEKSTVDINRWGIQPRWMKSVSPSSAIQIKRGAFKEAGSAGPAAPLSSSPARQQIDQGGEQTSMSASAAPPLTQPGAACSLDDECEACQ